MAKAPPWFPFYPGDFILGTADLTCEEVGFYLRLLLFQWASDEGISEDVDQLKQIAKLDPRSVRRMWPKIRQKFKRSSDGLWRNSRIEAERAKALKRGALLSDRATKAARARWPKRAGKGDATSTPKAMLKECQSQSQVRTSLEQAAFVGPDPSVLGSSRERRTTAHAPKLSTKKRQNGHANKSAGADTVAAAVRNRGNGAPASRQLQRMARPDRGHGDRARLPSGTDHAASGDTEQRASRHPDEGSESALAVDASAAIEAAFAAAGADAGSDNPAARPALGSVDAAGAPAEAVDRLRRIKDNIRSGADVHAGSRPRRRSRHGA
jgi:uncharacterized protein YdaU (DUF1376 family)